MPDDFKKELRTGASSLIGIALAAAGKSFAEWLRTRPLKNVIARRRAKRAKRKEKQTTHD
jgi:hypothetical protein